MDLIVLNPRFGRLDRVWKKSLTSISSGIGTNLKVGAHVGRKALE